MSAILDLARWAATQPGVPPRVRQLARAALAERDAFLLEVARLRKIADATPRHQGLTDLA